MALLPAIIASAKTTLSINDYTGSPNSITIAEVVVNALRPPIVETYSHEEVMINSSTGKARYSYPFLGLAGGQTFQLQFHLLDPKNNTDATVAVSLFRAMHKNSAAGTGYSGWSFVSQLTGLGALQAKALFVQRGEDGTSHTTTVPFVVTGVAETAVGEHEGFTVTCAVVGPVTVA